MKTIGEYVTIFHKDGTVKTYTKTQYRRRRAIRYTLYALAVAIAVLLMCGATHDIGRPEAAFAIIMMCGTSAALLTACVVAACLDGNKDEE